MAKICFVLAAAVIGLAVGGFFGGAVVGSVAFVGMVVFA